MTKYSFFAALESQYRGARVLRAETLGFYEVEMPDGLIHELMLDDGIVVQANIVELVARAFEA